MVGFKACSCFTIRMTVAMVTNFASVNISLFLQAAWHARKQFVHNVDSAAARANPTTIQGFHILGKDQP
jgi:hypothetical protein